MDVEGAEWDALLFAPDDLLDRIDQLVVEFHGVDDAKYAATLDRLKRFFVIADLHFNNFTCEPGLEPFPAWAYEVLFVNRRLGVPVVGDAKPASGDLHRPNAPGRPDCQEWVD
jgi:hypothetical protein